MNEKEKIQKDIDFLKSITFHDAEQKIKQMIKEKEDELMGLIMESIKDKTK